MSVPSTNLPPVVPRATSPHRTSPILSKSTVLYSQIPNLGNRTLQTTINTSQTYSTPKKNSSLSNFNVVSASSEKRERSPFHANITASSFSPQKPDELTRGSTNDEMIVNRPELVHYPQELQQRVYEGSIFIPIINAQQQQQRSLQTNTKLQLSTATVSTIQEYQLIDDGQGHQIRRYNHSGTTTTSPPRSQTPIKAQLRQTAPNDGTPDVPGTDMMSANTDMNQNINVNINQRRINMNSNSQSNLNQSSLQSPNYNQRVAPWSPQQAPLYKPNQNKQTLSPLTNTNINLNMNMNMNNGSSINSPNSLYKQRYVDPRANSSFSRTDNESPHQPRQLQFLSFERNSQQTNNLTQSSSSQLLSQSQLRFQAIQSSPQNSYQQTSLSHSQNSPYRTTYQQQSQQQQQQSIRSTNGISNYEPVPTKPYIVQSEILPPMDDSPPRQDACVRGIENEQEQEQQQENEQEQSQQNQEQENVQEQEQENDESNEKDQENSQQIEKNTSKNRIIASESNLKKSKSKGSKVQVVEEQEQEEEDQNEITQSSSTYVLKPSNSQSNTKVLQKSGSQGSRGYLLDSNTNNNNNSEQLSISNKQLKKVSSQGSRGYLLDSNTNNAKNETLNSINSNIQMKKSTTQSSQGLLVSQTQPQDASQSKNKVVQSSSSKILVNVSITGKKSGESATETPNKPK